MLQGRARLAEQFTRSLEQPISPLITLAPFFASLLELASHAYRSPIPRRPRAVDRQSRTACLGGFLGWYGYL